VEFQTIASAGVYHAAKGWTSWRPRPDCELVGATLGSARHEWRAGSLGNCGLRCRERHREADMADRLLKLSITKLARTVLPSLTILAVCVGAFGEEPNRPGCITRYENGKPYIFCEPSEEERLRRERPAAPHERPAPSPYETVVPRPSAPVISGDRDGAAEPSAGPAVGGSRDGDSGGAARRSVRGGSGGSQATGSRLWTVRALIEPAEMPPRELAGYGMVAFTTRPLPQDVERYKSVCEAYKATLMSQGELPPNTPLSRQMITYWPITNKNTPEAQRADCAHLVSNYALRLGLDAIQDADKRKEGLASRRGPFLIAWAPSESRFVPDAVVLVMNLSQFETQRSFTEIFQVWRQHITDNPELWQRNGFNIEAVRRIIRDTFDRYGDGLLRLITKT
jgi:hypothetical protein